MVLCTLVIAITPSHSGSGPGHQFVTPSAADPRCSQPGSHRQRLAGIERKPLLNVAAQNHVDDVIANGNWGHYGSDGSNVRQRAARVGYSTSSVSENWVAVSDPGQAIGWWMNDWITA